MRLVSSTSHRDVQALSEEARFKHHMPYGRHLKVGRTSPWLRDTALTPSMYGTSKKLIADSEHSMNGFGTCRDRGRKGTGMRKTSRRPQFGAR